MSIGEVCNREVVVIDRRESILDASSRRPGLFVAQWWILVDSKKKGSLFPFQTYHVRRWLLKF